MPVSNFWIKTTIDGRDGPVECGPNAEDGGFRTEVTQRNKGWVEQVVVLEGEAMGAGLVLRLRVWDDKGEMIYAHCTVR